MPNPPFKVRAIFDYSSPHDDDLNFPSGQIITVTAEEDADWYSGEYTNSDGKLLKGIFPNNFVEKLPEPQAPPRPSRSSAPAPKPEPVVPATEEDETEDAFPQSKLDTQPKSARESAPPAASVPAPQSPKAKPAAKSPPMQTVQPVAKPETSAPASSIQRGPSVGKKPPPPPQAKPEGLGSFRDRIAAFNKTSAPPIVPYNPNKPAAPSTFIKKPYVAPPPARNAYVPPPVQNLSQPKRDDESNYVRAAPTEAPTQSEASTEGAPKVSLKDRIALLQTAQIEHHGMPVHKEKPKRPPKPKRQESTKSLEQGEDDEEVATTEDQNQKGFEAPVVIRDMEREDQFHSEDDMHPPRKSVDERKRDEAPKRKPRPKADSVSSDVSVPSPSASRAVPDIPKSEETGDDGDDEGTGEDIHGEPSDMRDEDTEESDQASKPVTKRKESVGEQKAQDEENEDEEEDEDEEEVDPEVARKIALRERMAKMSGGMGMHGMFGAPMGGMPMPGAAPPRKKQQSTSSNRSGDSTSEYKRQSEPQEEPRIPMMPVPILPFARPPVASPPAVEQRKEVESKDDSDSDEEEGYPLEQQRTPLAPTSVSYDDEYDPYKPKDNAKQSRAVPPPPVRTSTSRSERHGEEPPMLSPRPVPDRPAPPPIPTDRKAPPLPQERPAPPPVPSDRSLTTANIYSPSEGSESDDELSVHAGKLSLGSDGPAASQPRAAPPPPPGGPAPMSPTSPTSPPIPKRASTHNKSGTMPAIPGAVPGGAPATRPPPPPPPSAAPQPPSRSNTYGTSQLSEEEVTEYEADYDTDMASGEAHRRALSGARSRDASPDEEETPLPSPVSAGPPPIPTAPAPPLAPRSMPPLPPGAPPKSKRQSSDLPRGAPPPIPMSPPAAPAKDESDEEDDYVGSSWQSTIEKPYNALPPPPPTGAPPMQPPPQSRPPGRPFEDQSRSSMTQGRRSHDQQRGGDAFIARDVDLGESSAWWQQPNTVPPVFQNRPKEIYYEIDENSSTRRGGHVSVTRDIYVLFHDYSQTVVTARFEKSDPAKGTLEQRHEAPPQPRQDVLEESHGKFGKKIHDAANTRVNTVVGEGDAYAFIRDLFKLVPSALPAVGTRAFGALVYANLANATVQQFDEIRAGDIVTFRNAKFSGHKGGLHSKYSMDVGKPEHVAVVLDWDGTKKKVRAFEQGREGKRVKIESFKIGDLKSGEVKVWRVMDRGWIGWEG